MSNTELTELLERHGVKATANRLTVAKTLLEEGRPLSLMELEDIIGTIDKSGIFRSLVLFREHRLVHTIEDGSDGTRYELCLSGDAEKDEDAHIHFFCEACHRTFCIEDVQAPEVCLPEGYIPRTVSYVVKGICPECSGAETAVHERF